MPSLCILEMSCFDSVPTAEDAALCQGKESRPAQSDFAIRERCRARNSLIEHSCSRLKHGQRISACAGQNPEQNGAPTAEYHPNVRAMPGAESGKHSADNTGRL